MISRMRAIGMLVMMSLAAVGCQNKLAEENRNLWQENRALRARLSDAEGRLKSAPDPSQLQAMQGEIAARDQKIAELEAQLRQPTPGANEPGLEGIETSYNPGTGEMTVNIPGDILFDSGKATLKDSAKSTLNKIVAAIKKDYAGKKIFVDGHSDSDPISKTKDQWEDNLDLSAARARTVAKYLTSQGIDPKLVGTRAFGETSPKGTKAASRRVEIVVATR
jgi:flagellar motor protein MotB